MIYADKGLERHCIVTASPRPLLLQFECFSFCYWVSPFCPKNRTLKYIIYVISKQTDKQELSIIFWCIFHPSAGELPDLANRTGNRFTLKLFVVYLTFWFDWVFYNSVIYWHIRNSVENLYQSPSVNRSRGEI